MEHIQVRVRFVIVRQGRLLVHFDSEKNYYYYPGGHVDFGETISEAAQREIKEEFGDDVVLDFIKILYVRDYIPDDKSEHSLEIYVLGGLNKFGGLEHRGDPQFGGKTWLTWLEIDKLPNNLYPQKLTSKLVDDHKNGFPGQGEYLGKI